MPAPLPFTWPYALIFWPVYVWVFIPEFRLVGRTPLTTPTSVEDRGSMRVVFVAVGLAIIGAFAAPFVSPAASFPAHRAAWFFFGLAVLISGSLLRRSCFRALGRFFTGAVAIQPEHRVIISGPYRFVRHPSYTAALLILAGIGLALGNWLSILICVVVGLCAYTYRAHVEERALLSALGGEYERYMATRKRFIPFIY